MILLPPIFFFACFVVTLLAAKAQSGGVTRSGAVAAAYIAGLATLPGVVLFAVASAYEISPLELAAGGSVALMVFAMGMRVVKQPFGHAVPMDEPTLEATIARVAQRAGLRRVPRLLRLRTLGALPVYGWVAVLHEPVVILADGLVHRLEPDEHEAILAHEIAHVRTGSLWWLQLSLPIAATISMATLVWVDMWVAAGSTWALWAFLARIISRPTELLCDRRAAALTSPQAMISGLRKMQAVHPVRDPGWRWTVAWALATHPPTELRIHELGEAQGPLARRLRLTSATGFGIWLLLYLAVFSTWWLLPSLDSFFIAVTLGLLGLGLQLAPRLAARSSIRRRSRLIPPGLPGHKLGRAGLVMLLIAMLCIIVGWLDWWTVLLLLGAVISSGIGAIRGRGLRALRHRLHKAMQAQDFETVRRLGIEQANKLRRDPGARHDVALANLACGYTHEGFEALEGVVRRAPKLLMAVLTLGNLKLPRDPKRSLELGALLSLRLPKDPLGPLLEARAQQRLGHHHKAMAAWTRARVLEADDPGVLIMAMELAIDAGSLDEAEAWSTKARVRAPGELTLLLAQARLAIIQARPSAASDHLARARAVMADHPLAFLGWRLEELECELAIEE